MPYTIRTAERVEVLGEAFGGRAERHHAGGHTLPVVHLKGSPEEMGRQHGALMGGVMLENLAMVRGIFEADGMPGDLVETILLRVWEYLAPHAPERFIREMEGIAEGAQAAGFDVSIDRVRAIQASTNLDIYKRDEMLMSLFSAEELQAAMGSLADVPPMSCTMFAVWGSRTEGGKLFAHRNLDWISQTGMHNVRQLTVYQPEDQQPFVSMGYTGLVGSLAGMNAAGITMAEVGTFSASQRMDGCPWTFMARRVLEESAQLEDAVEIISQTRHTHGYNYLAADGDPDAYGTDAYHPRAVAFETNAEACEAFYANDPKEADAQWVSASGECVRYGLQLEEAVMRGDTAFAAKTRAAQVADNGPGEADNDGDPRCGTYVECHKPMRDMMEAYANGEAYVFPLRGTEVIEAGAPRKIGPEEAIAIAGTVAHNTEKLDDNDWNVMSVVYAPTDGEFWLAYEHQHDGGQWTNAPDTGYWHYKLRDLLQP